MKKAQMSEFMSIIILVIILVAALIITKINSYQTSSKQIEESLSNYRLTYILTTSTLFPYLTVEGEKIGLLLGRYSCYRNEVMTGRTGDPIYFFPTVREKLDEIYGQDMWAIELNAEMCITSTDIFGSVCHIDPEYTYYSFDMLISTPCTYEDITGVLSIIVT